MKPFYEEEYYKKAQAVFKAYQDGQDRDEFIDGVNKVPYFIDDLDFLFALCNAAHHAGYVSGCEDTENES